jgi:hypothetical protein
MVAPLRAKRRYLGLELNGHSVPIPDALTLSFQGRTVLVIRNI